MPDVPTKSSLKTSAKNGGVNGLASGIGKTLGRGILGPGIGTAAGGIAAASMLDGNDRDIVATMAVDQAVGELFMSGSGGQRQGVK
jgi:hypothetical protein